MGAWGVGPLDNDAALDLVSRFNTEGWPAVAEALAEGVAKNESMAQEKGIGGAMLVAASRSNAVDAGPVAAVALTSHQKAPLELVAAALAAVRAAQQPGQLRALWADTDGDLPEWLGGLDRLADQLSA